MSGNRGEKRRNERLNSGPTTRLESKNNRSKSKSKSRFNSNGFQSNSRKSNTQNRKQVIFMVIVLIAFICGIIIGASFIFGDDSGNGDGSQPQYMNVTKNISEYGENANVSYEINETIVNDTVNNTTYSPNTSNQNMYSQNTSNL